MWERIAASGMLIVGAFVLFAVFTAALFLLERKDEKKADSKASAFRTASVSSTKKAA